MGYPQRGHCAFRQFGRPVARNPSRTGAGSTADRSPMRSARSGGRMARPRRPRRSGAPGTPHVPGTAHLPAPGRTCALGCGCRWQLGRTRPWNGPWFAVDGTFHSRPVGLRRRLPTRGSARRGPGEVGRPGHGQSTWSERSPQAPADAGPALRRGLAHSGEPPDGIRKCRRRGTQ